MTFLQAVLLRSQTQSLLEENARMVKSLRSEIQTIARNLRGFASRESDKIIELLTNREIEILRYVCDGRTSKWVAARLGISKRTVDFHRSNIMDKLDEPNACGLARWAAHLPAVVQHNTVGGGGKWRQYIFINSVAIR